MGTRISLSDPVYGPDCPTCFAVGKTPQTIYAWFWEVLKGDKVGALEPPNLHLFTLTQDDVNQCLWKNNIGAFGWDVQLQIFAGPNTRLIIYRDVIKAYFSCTLAKCPVEHDIFDNALWHPPGAWGYNGHGIIQWLETASDLIEDFVLPTSNGLLMEFTVDETGQPIYKFNDVETSTNVKFKVEP